MLSKISDISELLWEHTEWRARCLNLTASENLTSKALRHMLTCDLAHRYGTYFDDPSKRNYEGNKYIAKLEIETMDLASEVLGADYVDLRPLGGEMAGKAVITALTKMGDIVYETGEDGYGGHGVTRRLLTTSLFQNLLQLKYLPFDSKTYDIDIDQLKQDILQDRPKLIIFGSSQLLFPESIDQIRSVAQEVGAYISYDVSHVLGLIAGGAYPNPLDLGVDVLHGSTHKTFPGPQGGIILTRNKDLFKRIRKGVYPTFVTNHHLHRIPAFAVQLLEFKKFGKQYVSQILKNSRRLGKELNRQGINTLYGERGYTQTHLVLVDVAEFGGGTHNAKKLEVANIILGPGGASIPCDLETDKKSGLRIGTQEITRTGMKEEDMTTVAELIARVVVRGEEPQAVAKDVGEFMSSFNEIKYCFDPGHAAYETAKTVPAQI